MTTNTMQTKKTPAQQRGLKIILIIFITIAILFTIGVFTYTKISDAAAEKVVASIIRNSSDSNEASDAAGIYNSMSKEDKAKLKAIVAKSMSISNLLEIRQYVNNNDAEGLWLYASDNLSASDMSTLQGLYEKYSHQK